MRKREGGLYEIEVRSQRIPGSGRITLSSGTRKKTEAAGREALLRKLIDLGEFGVIARLRNRSDELDWGALERADKANRLTDLRPTTRGALTLGAAVERVLRDVEATRSAGTLTVYRNQTKQILRAFPEDALLADITSDQIREFLYSPRGRRMRPFSPNSMHNVHMVGARLWRLAIAQEAEAAARDGTRPLLTLNPWDLVELPEQRPTRAGFLRPAQWRKLVEVTQDRPQAALMAVGTLAGLRMKEALYLRTAIDVDLERRRIRVQSREGEYAFRVKTRRGERDVPMAEELHRIITRHIELGYAGEKYLIRLPRQDHPMRQSTAQAWTAAAFESAGIRYGQKADALTYHNTRHTFASWLAQQGVDVLRIAKLLGDTVEQVIETYAHLLPENLEEAVRVVDSMAREGK